jgi:hypothetical protein
MRLWVLGLALLGCAPRGASTLLVETSVDDAASRPSAIQASVFGPHGLLARGATVVPSGSEVGLGTIAVEVPDEIIAVRVVVAGYGATPTLGGAQTTTRLHAETRFPVTLSASFVDTDGDDVPDALDDCPTVPDPDQANSDGEGPGDACTSPDGGGLVDCGTALFSIAAGSASSIGAFVSDAVSPYELGNGLSFKVDTGNTQRLSNVIDLSGIAACAAPKAVYQSDRFVQQTNTPPAMTYAFSGLQPWQNYRLRLHFADLTDTSPGQRRFNVYANGIEILTGFDVIETAGGPLKGTIVERARTTTPSGTMLLEFESLPLADGTTDTAAFVNGIEILP